jgi:GNAT superfamily N-acetyltransferase
LSSRCACTRFGRTGRRAKQRISPSELPTAARSGISQRPARNSWASTLLEHPQNGWIIGVYVVPNYRRRGIARALTDAALSWLRRTECVNAKLHASPYGRGIYEALGFTLSNEMKLPLRPD